jgi:polysaccharide biosynthesis protein VpsD
MSALDGERSFGGVDSACQTHLQGLTEIAQDDSEYIIVAFNKANDLEQDGREICIGPNITLHWYNYARRADGFDKIPNVVKNELLVRKLIKQFSPDIVHSHLPQWHIKKWAGEKKILTLHQFHNIGRTSAGLLNDLLHRDLIEPTSIRNADALTCVSRDVIDVLSSSTNGAVHYIPNAINQHYFSLRRRVTGDGRVNLLMAGTLSRAKRVMDALEVVRRLKADHPEIRLTLAGKFGSDQDFNRQFLSFIEAHLLEDHVHIAGILNRDEMIRHMEETHIGLFLSEQETFGLAGLECLAAGLPLVTTRVGVFNWQIEDFASRGVDLVGVGDIGAVTKAVASRIRSKAYDMPLGMHMFLNENFSRRACAAKYHKLYEAA